MMNRTVKMISRWLKDHGFSVGIEDVTPSQYLLDKKAELTRKAFIECDEVRFVCV